MDYYIARMARTYLAVLVALSLFPSLAGAQTTFPATGQSVWGPFESFWKANGGLAQFGLPRTGVFPGGEGFDAQWFERALFTYNPKNADPFKVELQLLGSLATAGRRSEPAFGRAAKTTGLYFESTGHNLSGRFLDHWQRTGGLRIYGYPISEPFTERSKADGKPYLVQYFERNRFELHPELSGTPYEVQLGLLGSELLDLQGGPVSVAALGSPRYYPSPTASDGVSTPGGGSATSPNAGDPSAGGTPGIPAAPDLPPTTRAVIFQADFAGDSLDGWLPATLSAEAGGSPSGWRVRNGLLEQSEVAREEGTSEDALLLIDRGAARVADFALDMAVLGNSGEPVGVVFGHTESGYQLLRLYSSAPNSSPKATLLTVRGSDRWLVSAGKEWAGYKPGEWLLLTVVAKGPEVVVQVNGQPILSAARAVSSGSIGLYAYADGSARFDNVRLTAP